MLKGTPQLRKHSVLFLMGNCVLFLMFIEHQYFIVKNTVEHRLKFRVDETDIVFYVCTNFTTRHKESILAEYNSLSRKMMSLTR
jgi:hypothetical protein